MNRQNTLIIALLLALVTIWTVSARAEQFPVQARFFAGVTNTDPTDLNEEMTVLGLKEFKTIPQFGVEATYALTSFIDTGIRYQKRYQSNLETTPTTGQEYSALLDQDAVLLIARVPLFLSPILRLDIFGGVGGTNTTLTLKTASQNGELLKRESGDWFASLITSFGASAAVGYKGFFFFVEGGFESNKVDTFKRTGTAGPNIEAIDLTGGYVTVGLLIDGLTATR